MKKSFRMISLLPLMFLMYSCGFWQAPSPPEWQFKKGAVNLQLKADPRLNLYEGMPHPLIICVYQLANPNAFNRLAENVDGLYKLLECEHFDGSVTSSKRLIVHPGQDLTVSFDRAEGTRYVAVVAGYYQLEKEGMMNLFEVPVIVKREGLSLARVSKPDLLNMKLILGPHQLGGSEKNGKE